MGDGYVVCCLRQTKTGSHQRVVVTSAWALRFLAQFLRHYPRHEPQLLVGVGYARVRYWIQKAAVVCGYGPDTFRSHSLRRGAATALFMSNVPLTTIMHLGRWSTESSCRLYIQSAEALMARMQSGGPGASSRVLALASLPDPFTLAEQL